uniref:sulfatase-like hydrolase/transferase n=1 Tax=Chloroflexus sp. TaxID=1904827 RepID=UPI002ACEE721
MVSRRPDIVLLVLDTQRSDRLSCFGYPRPTSPHLDAFATSATIFQRAFATAQWTIPSHASLLTGVYPIDHKTNQSWSVLPPDLPTLAERLRAGGYFTAAFCNNPLVGVV